MFQADLGASMDHVENKWAKEHEPHKGMEIIFALTTKKMITQSDFIET